MNDLLYEVAFSLLPGMGTNAAKQVLNQVGTSRQLFEIEVRKLKKVLGLRKNTYDALLNKETLVQAEKIIEDCLKHDVQILFLNHADYPLRLKQIADAPLVLYVKGNMTQVNQRAVAVVGTRKPTAYGKEQTDLLVKALQAWNPVVVSGLAFGIDAQAHKASLHHGLPTYAVLGSGVQQVYPPEHKDLACRILEQQGAIMSEYPPFQKAEIYHFPERNRIIAGLSEAVIVVEAASKGGALITAQLANSYDREVMAIPGHLNHKYSMGCNDLIKTNQAHLYTNIDDLVQLLNWDLSSAPVQTSMVMKDTSMLSEHEKGVYELLLKEDALPIDEIAWKTSLTTSQTASILLNLEMMDYVKMLVGKKFKVKA
jgi:DNA processing protein